MIHCGDQNYADLLGVADTALPYYWRQYRTQGSGCTAQVLAALPHHMAPLNRDSACCRSLRGSLTACPPETGLAFQIWRS